MEFFIWFIFGDVIIAAFAITLTVCCFNVLADLIGFPREDVSQVINTFTYYFWPALIAGGFLSGITRKVRTALKCLGVWLRYWCFSALFPAISHCRKRTRLRLWKSPMVTICTSRGRM